MFLTSALSAAQPAVAATPVTIDGQLEILFEDHPGFSRVRHTLKTDQGRIELRFARGHAPTGLRSGARLRARGQLDGRVLALADSGSLSVTSTVPPTFAIGEQRLAVLMVNFVDDTRQPFSAAQVNDVVFAQAGNYMRENSYQRTWLAGTTFGWYTLPIAHGCDGTQIATAARQAAAQAGVDLSGYPRVLYLFPSNTTCGWSGLGTVGGSTSEAWINGTLQLKVVAHELGHNFGLWHAHSSDCDATPLGPNCTQIDYGDTADAMGNVNASHYGAFMKETLGWLGGAATSSIATATASGNYTIQAYEGSSGGAKALKVLKGIDAATGARVWYYVEYRRPVGYDAALATQYGSNLVAGLIVRQGTEGDANSSYMLDMTPATIPTFDLGDAALVAGQSFVDATAGVMLTLAGADANAATVQLSLGSPTAGCARAAPQLALAGSATAVAAGTPVSYALTVTNRDSAACSAATFNLAGAVPAGWAVSVANPALSLVPGASATTSLVATSSATALGGSYPVSATATPAAATQLAASASATYSVAAATVQTGILTDRAVYSRNDTVRASATVLVGGRATAGIAVSVRLVKPNGAVVQLNATSDAAGVARVSYRVARKDPFGAWTARSDVTVSGAAASADTGFSVQ